jgi:hypothetical protein
MLIEGIDDPSCTMLAIYEPFANTRMLVQQVGRLTRQPSGIGTKSSDAYVLARSGDDVSRIWGSFIDYDRACVASGGKPPIRNDEKVLRNLVDALPKMDYVAGRFRERIDLESADLKDDLRFPRSAIIFETDSSFDLDEFQAQITEALDAEDRFQHQIGIAASGTCRYHLTLRLSQSPFLAEYLFQTAALEITIYAQCGNRLFFYDSAGLWVDELGGVGSRTDPFSLRSLLPAGANNAISFISVQNTDLGPLVLRSRSMSARSLERAGVFMGEHLNVVSRAVGRVIDRRRSVGFTRGRVRDGQGAALSASEFAAWCTTVGEELDLAKPAAPLLSRFAIPTDIPAVTEPANILIDMVELIGEFRNKRKTSAKFSTENLCADIVFDADPKAPAPYRFEITVDKEQIKIWIAWNAKKKKYWLISPDLSQLKSKDNEKISLTRRLNRTQPFRIITADLKHVYVHGSFYALNLDLADPTGAGRMVLDLITPVAELASITSEKGKPRGERLRTWRKGSLFRLIDDALVAGAGPHLLGPTFPALVCEDLGTEAADFIGVDDAPAAPRVSFIVAKWHEGTPSVSAAAFYDVAAQGIKTLAYLKADGTPVPGTLRKYDNDWTMSVGKGSAKVTDEIPRLRSGPPSITFRKLLDSARSAPRCDRSVWLVCAGGLLSRGTLEREFDQVPPKAHVLQFYHLVVSIFSSCQSVGVDLRIFSAD